MSQPAGLRPIGRTGFDAPQFGLTGEMLVTDDGSHAYPILEGMPALMWPEVCLRNDESVNLEDHRYWEAYSEMEYYNPVSRTLAEDLSKVPAYWTMKALIDKQIPSTSFPDPPELWIDKNSFEFAGRLKSYQYIAPLEGKVAVNLGGHGRDAIRFLLAGAAQAILVTPMIGEAILGWRLAEALGVSDRFSCVLGIGEELPFLDGCIDVISSHGCMHHMRLDLTFPELRRVLRKGGRFIATDPWRTPLYGPGTWILGQREQGLFNRDISVFCRPITPQRLETLSESFPSHTVSNHGPILRYALIALNKLFGIRFSQQTLYKLALLDDRMGSALGLRSSWGSSVFFGGERS